MAEENLKKYLLKTPARDKWERIGTQKRAGVLVPLFSIYSKKSIGIGDFEDLKLLIDWCNKSGNSIIQLLPLNEVGSTYCPYDALSSFALEPACISLEKISGANRKSIKDGIKKLKAEFPSGKARVDYSIKKEKLKVLWDIFLNETRHPEDFKNFIETHLFWVRDFALFKGLKDYHQGKPWYEWEEKYKNRDLLQLEVFHKEHEKQITFQAWAQWQLYQQFTEVKKYAQLKKVLLKGDLTFLVSRDSADVWAHQELFKLEFSAGAPADMYCAKGQRWGMPTYNWEKVSSDDYRYLKEKLKYAQEFYDILRIDHVVGLFRIWSIPYNEPWENQGLHGFFDPQDESKWKEQGSNILSLMLKNTKMLLCAEDLGIIPKVCTKVLQELGIPGNDVQRWVKDWKVKHDFLVPQDYRVLSVAMLSTHDTTNWAAWWENEAGTVDEALFIRKCAERRIDYSFVKERLFDTFDGAKPRPEGRGSKAPLSINPEQTSGFSPRCVERVDLNLSRHGRLRWLNSISSSDQLISILGKKREEIADFIDLYENSYQEKEKLWRHLKMPGPMQENANKDIIAAALRLTLESRAIFCIQLIVDWLSLSDIIRPEYYQYRINTPGTINKNNWSLVIPISLEGLLKNKVTQKIKKMIVPSGR